MPAMCSLIARGWFLNDVEKYLADPMRQLQFQGELGTAQPLLAALTNVGLLNNNTAALKDHLEKDWIGSRWWPQTNKESILRWGLITLIDKARQFNAKPCIRWICIGDKFQCMVTHTANDVVMVLLTPPVPLQGLRGPTTEPDETWVISNEPDMRETLAKVKFLGSASKPLEGDCRLLDGAAGVWCTPVYADKHP